MNKPQLEYYKKELNIPDNVKNIFEYFGIKTEGELRIVHTIKLLLDGGIELNKPYNGKYNTAIERLTTNE